MWFIVVWCNGDRENPFEDYPPDWITVSELKAGRFDWTGDGIHRGSYSAEWLAPEETAHLRQELGISIDDF